MEPVAAATGRRRRDIQGLRAVAVAAVVAFHAGLPLHGGYLGVDVFFVISGLVISGLLLREHRRDGRLNLRRFYGRRVRRLVPALALVVTVTVVASSWILSPVGAQQTATLTGLASLALSANIVVARRSGDYFGSPAETNPLLHTWSLSVEEQFYLVYPALLLVGLLAVSRGAARAKVGYLALRPVVLGAWVISLASALLAVSGALGVVSNGLLVGFYSPLPRAWEFGLGAVLAFAATSSTPRWWSHRLVGPIGAALLFMALLVPSGGTALQLPMTFLATGGTALLLAAGGGERRAASTSVLSWRPLVALGDRSYSVYLWHWPLIVLAGIAWRYEPWVAPVSALASVPLAFIAFRVVEDPLRRRPSGLSVNLSGVVAASLIPPVLVAAAVVVHGAQVRADPELGQAVAAREKAAAAVGHCDTEVIAWCSWPVRSGSRPVYLVGDSHAGHLSDGVRAAAVADGRDSRATMAYYCPLLLHLEVSYRGSSNGCAARNVALVSQLKASTPGTVVVAASDAYWSSPGWAARLNGVKLDEPTQRLGAFEEDLEGLVRVLRSAGHDVILVQSVPLHVGFAWEACSLQAIRERSCTDEVPVSEAQATQGRTRAAIARAAAASGAEVLDPWTTLCGDGTCSTTRAGVALYRNASHLSVRGSGELTASLSAVL